MSEVMGEKVPYSKAAVVVFCLCIVAWGLNWYLLFDWYPNSAMNSAANRGTFGDMFGAVNAIFSGLSFAGIVYALILQRHEISLAHKELKRTSQIIDEQRKQIQTQNKASELASFEQSFFQLFNLLRNIVDKINTKEKNYGHEIIGSEIFQSFMGRLKEHYERESKANYPVEMDQMLDCLDKSYDLVMENYDEFLGNYFRVLYNIVKLIDRSSVDDKKYYTNLIRAYFSRYEVAALFHSCLSKRAREKFLPLIKKYSLLKHLRDEDIFDIRLKEALNTGVLHENKAVDV